ncbi:MAG: DMT family transporter [Proteobacteria bacterium]|nr:DMT family transporter [Pseudomonadota bacterium]
MKKSVSEASLSHSDLDVPPLVFLRGAAFGISAITIWAGWMVFTRVGLKTELSPYDIAALRFATAGLLLLPILIKRGLALDRLGWSGFIILVSGAGAPYALIASSGLLFAPAGHAGALIPGTMPLFVAILSIIFLRERIDSRRRLGFFLIFCGILIIAGMGVILSTGNQWVGHFLFLTAACMWAGFTISMKRAALSALHATAIVAVISMFIYLPVYLIFIGLDGIEAASASDSLFQAFYQGVLTSVVSLILYSKGVTILGASQGAAFASLVPVMATMLAIPFLGEIPTERDLIGIAAVTVGVYLATGARFRIRATIRAT